MQVTERRYYTQDKYLANIEDEVIAIHSIVFQISLENLYSKVNFERLETDDNTFEPETLS